MSYSTTMSRRNSTTMPRRNSATMQRRNSHSVSWAGTHPIYPAGLEITFGHSEYEPRYRLSVNTATSKPGFDGFVHLEISSQPAPRRLGGDRWEDCQIAGKVNRGKLYFGILNSISHREADHDVPVAVKWVRGAAAIASLQREASLYDSALRPLQGTVVPTFYGFYTGHIDGVEIGCLVLEWIEHSEPTFMIPGAEELRLRALAIHKLHASGVYHGQLCEREDSLCLSDGRHFLRAPDGTVRVVDFQQAFAHLCNNGYGHIPSSNCRTPAQDCEEWLLAERQYQRAIASGPRMEKNIAWNLF